MERPKRKAREIAEKTIHLQYRDPFMVKRMGVNFFGDVEKWRPADDDSQQRHSIDQDFVLNAADDECLSDDFVVDGAVNERTLEVPRTPKLARPPLACDPIIRITKLHSTPILPEVADSRWILRDRLIRRDNAIVDHIDKEDDGTIVAAQNRKKRRRRNKNRLRRSDNIVIKDPVFVEIARRRLSPSKFVLSDAESRKEPRKRKRVKRERQFIRKRIEKAVYKSSNLRVKRSATSQIRRKSGAPTFKASHPTDLSFIRSNRAETSEFFDDTMIPSPTIKKPVPRQKSRKFIAPKKNSSQSRVLEDFDFVSISAASWKFIDECDVVGFSAFDTLMSDSTDSHVLQLDEIMKSMWDDFVGTKGERPFSVSIISRWMSKFSLYLDKEYRPNCDLHQILDLLNVNIKKYTNMISAGSKLLSSQCRNIASMLWCFSCITCLELDSFPLEKLMNFLILAIREETWNSRLRVGSTNYFIVCSISLLSSQRSNAIKAFLSSVDIADNVGADAAWKLFELASIRNHMLLDLAPSLFVKILKSLPLSSNQFQVASWFGKISDLHLPSSAIDFGLLTSMRDVILNMAIEPGRCILSNQMSFDIATVLLDESGFVGSLRLTLQRFDGRTESVFIRNLFTFVKLLSRFLDLACDDRTRKIVISKFFLIQLPKGSMMFVNESQGRRNLFICFISMLFLEYYGDFYADNTAFLAIVMSNETPAVWLVPIFGACLSRAIAKGGPTMNLFELCKKLFSLAGLSNYDGAVQFLCSVMERRIGDKNLQSVMSMAWIFDPTMMSILRSRNENVRSIQTRFMTLVNVMVGIISEAIRNGSLTPQQSFGLVRLLPQMEKSVDVFITNSFDPASTGLNIFEVKNAVNGFVAISSLSFALKGFPLGPFFDTHGPNAFSIVRSNNRFTPVQRIRALAFTDAFLKQFPLTADIKDKLRDQLLVLWLQSFLDPLMRDGPDKSAFQELFYSFNESLIALEILPPRYRIGGGGVDAAFATVMSDYEREMRTGMKLKVRRKYVDILSKVIQVVHVGYMEASSVEHFYFSTMLAIFNTCCSLIYHADDNPPLLDLVESKIMTSQCVIQSLRYQELQKEYFLCLGSFPFNADAFLRGKLSSVYVQVIVNHAEESDLYISLLLTPRYQARQLRDWILLGMVPMLRKNSIAHGINALRFMTRVMEICIRERSFSEEIQISIELFLLSILEQSKGTGNPELQYTTERLRFLLSVIDFFLCYQHHGCRNEKTTRFTSAFLDLQLIESVSYTGHLFKLQFLDDLIEFAGDLFMPREMQNLKSMLEEFGNERRFSGMDVPNVECLQTDCHEQVVANLEDIHLDPIDRTKLLKDYIETVCKVWKGAQNVSPTASQFVAGIRAQMQTNWTGTDKKLGRLFLKHLDFELPPKLDIVMEF